MYTFWWPKLLILLALHFHFVGVPITIWMLYMFFESVCNIFAYYIVIQINR
jgi:hypothetical protein